MCGICGILYFESEHNVDEQSLREMTTTLAHRGPDGDGYYIDNHQSVGFGFRRLSIIDVLGCSQPLLSEDCATVLVGNGEIYNFRELRARLSQTHQFQTQGDIETILHLYEDVALDCVYDLRGMFAFAIWDSRRQRLILSVDHFGQKPLYYAADREKIVFASELKALLRDPAISHELDLVALDEYLSCGYITAPRTILRSVRKLSPGHTLVVDRSGEPILQSYWQPQFCSSDRWHRASFEELACALRLHLQRAVSAHAVSDVPLGVFLSGGIDSSTVVALLSQEHRAFPLKSFTVAFSDTDYDESSFARLVAQRYEMDHEAVLVDSADALETLPSLIRQFDEPFADSSMIPTYLLARHARHSVKTVLTGDGGDEVFGGYAQHLYAQRQALLEQFIPARLHPVATRMSNLLPKLTKIKPYLAAMDQSYSHWRAPTNFFSAAQRRKLHGNDSPMRGAADPYVVENQDGLSQVQLLDLTTYLPGDILVKIDRAAMLASLETRSPLLDLDLFEFMSAVPPSYRVGARAGKRLLRKSVEDLLPAPLLRRKKQGFSIPQGEWLRSVFKPLVEDVVIHPREPLFDSAYVQALVGEHMSGQADHKDRLWALLCFELWAREYL